MVDKLEAAAIDQNDAMRQELAHIGNLVTDLARKMKVDQANDDGSWPNLAGRVQRLIDASPTEDAQERVKVLEEALFEARQWVKAEESSDQCTEATLAAMQVIDNALGWPTALGNKQTPLSLSDADAGNPQKSAPPALGNKETDRHG